MSIVDDARAAVPPNRAVEIGIVAFVGAAVVVSYWADRRYRRWAKDFSLFAAPRARAAAFQTNFQTNYRRKRSGVEEIARIIGDIFEAVEQAGKRVSDTDQAS